MQSIFRQRLARVKFKNWRKSLLRVVIVEIKGLPLKIQTLENAVVIVTVVDTFRNVQLFRFDKTTEEVRKEAFFIPGKYYYYCCL